MRETDETDAHHEQFLPMHNAFKSRLLQIGQNVSICEQGLNWDEYTSVDVIDK